MTARRDRRFDVESQLVEPMRDIAENGLLPAAVIGTAGNVQRKPVTPVDLHQRRITIAPIGQRPQKRYVGVTVFVQHVERRKHCPRLYNALAGHQAEALRDLVERRQAHPVATAPGEDDRWVIEATGGAPENTPSTPCDSVG
jgi:hypothetical protein